MRYLNETSSDVFLNAKLYAQVNIEKILRTVKFGKNYVLATTFFVHSYLKKHFNQPKRVTDCRADFSQMKVHSKSAWQDSINQRPENSGNFEQLVPESVVCETVM